MSLTDALLLEGYRDPRDVWIALRTDGVKGSGTIDDPYDGSRRDFTSYAISSLSKGGAGNRVATAVTASDHPFSPGDTVTVAGVGTGQSSDRYYTGTFQVASATSNSFTYQMLGEPTSSQAPGTITCFREREQFDTVMRAMPANCAIHLGPGVFESKGIAPEIANYELKNGQRILGSGRAVTTLKLVGAGWPELTYLLIAPHVYYAYLEDIEVSDLTFDCNIAGQPEPLVSCAAVAIAGRHVRLRRLRAVNFASQTTGYVENFVFAVGAPHPDAGQEGVNCVIDDCTAEIPGLNAANNSSVFILSSGERPTDGIMFYHRAFAIRNCWYDGTLADRPVPISGITISAGVATVTTRVPHLRNDNDNNDWVVIAGAVENGSAQSAYNGTYQIFNVSTYQFSYTPVAYLGRDGALSVPTSNPTGDMWVDRFSSHRIPVQKLERDASDSTVAILTSHGPHFRKPGQWVRVYSVSSPTPAGTEAYYGRFPIIDDGITSPGVLKYRMNSAPTKLIVQDTACPGGSTTCQQDTVFLGVGNVGFSSDGGSEAVAEGNRVFNTAYGGSYHDTWGTKDQTDRNNYYSDVLSGPYQNMGQSSALKLGSLSVAGTTATFTTVQPHGLVVGQAVRINPLLGTPPQEYFAVTAVPTATTFTFQVSGTVTLVPPYSFGALWQVGLTIRDNNVIELGQAHHVGTGYGYSSGLPFYAGLHGTQYVFRSVIARDNIIRLSSASSNPFARAIQLQNIEKALVERNVSDVLYQPSIDVYYSGPLHFFNNETSSGALIRPAAGIPTDPIADDLRTRIEDAMMFAL